ncbi:hypothetical protein M0R45_026227 [Rubus argutus]|uniref:Uncharacterized protein n=1 Tax=Rubus argutus TaxID=59490 RepID=A0AAW1WYA1_RUBAR
MDAGGCGVDKRQRRRGDEHGMGWRLTEVIGLGATTTVAAREQRRGRGREEQRRGRGREEQRRLVGIDEMRGWALGDG